ncbi:protein kinase [Streptomyces sp. NPDC048603]|uniref:protein kinase domain-containing protein n=1 Tax=Streptomyces sp. NPDC048603 TaxID=3365577 RepID=UPI00372178D7
MSGSPLLPDDPERIGAYWLAARLGAGAQGVVYEAYDARGTRVALKALHRDADPVVRTWFAREARAARRVAAFCTARVLDAAVDGDTPYLVSEYVPGPTLAAEVRASGPLARDAVLRLATGAATALVAIHAAGVVHRDLKPGNVLLGPDGPRIIDFGIARAPDMSVTVGGAIMGTFGYMAPEVLSGRGASAASDVFAWGAVVLYAATGTEPFRGETVPEVVYRTTSVDPDLSPLPPRLRPLIAAALAKEPELRPGAHDLLTGLIAAATPAPARSAPPGNATGPADSGGPGGAQGTPDRHNEPGDPANPANPDNLDSEAGLDLLRAGVLQADEAPLVPASEAVPPLGDRAEAAYAALAPDAQLAARELLLRLTVPGGALDGSQDTVRTATRTELLAGRTEAEQHAVTRAAHALAEAGVLLVEPDGALRPVSTALLPAWQRLSAWTAADRTLITHRQRLTATTHRWAAHGRRPEDLLTGSELRVLLESFSTAPAYLRPSPAELEFLSAARAEAARGVRRRRRLRAGLAAATVLALLAGAVAYLQNREAGLRAAEAERRQAEAKARTVAQTADSLRGQEPDTARLLGLAAYRIAPVPESRGALYASLTQLESETLALPRLDSGQQSGTALTETGSGVVVYTPVAVTFTDLASPAGPGRTARPLSGDLLWGEAGGPVISPDGRLVLRKAAGGRAEVVEIATGKALAASFPIDQVSSYSVRLTNRGHVVDSGSDTGRGRVLDPSGKPVTTARGAVSPDGVHQVTCDSAGLGLSRLDGSGAIGLATAANGACDRETVFSPDGSRIARLANGTPKGTNTLGVPWPDRYTYADVWDTKGNRTGSMYLDLTDVHLSSKGNYLFGYSPRGDLEIWRTDGNRLLASLPPFSQRQKRDGWDRAALDETTKSLVLLSSSDSLVRRVDLSAVLDLPAPARETVTAAASGDGTKAVVREGFTDMQQRLVDLRTGKTLLTVPQRWRELPTRHVYNALSHDGTVLAFTDYTPDGAQHIVLWDTVKNREVHRFTPADDTVRRLTLSPDGRYVSAYVVPGGVRDGSGGTIQVWDVQQRKEIRRFPHTTGYGRFSPDGALFATTTGQVLDLASGAVRDGAWGPGAAVALAFSPDGRLLALVRDTGSVELWDGAGRTRIAHVPGSAPRPESQIVDDADEPVFSQDGTLLAAVASGDRLQMWDTGARLALGSPLPTGGRRLDVLAFGPDGVLRALGGSHTAAFDLVPEHAAAAVCKRVGRDITPEEWRTYIPGTPYRKVC